jgi:hypothetical protein
MIKSNKFIFWAPRIISILLILFLTMFSLDVFEGNYGFWGTIFALIMHNIPVFILVILLIISWKHELVGAIAFVLAGLFYIWFLLTDASMNAKFEWYMLSWSMIIAGPAFVAGYLFYLNWKRKKRKKK